MLTYGGWPTNKTYLQQFCMDIGCILDLPEVMDDRDKWKEREKSMLAAHDGNDDI